MAMNRIPSVALSLSGSNLAIGQLRMSGAADEVIEVGDMLDSMSQRTIVSSFGSTRHGRDIDLKYTFLTWSGGQMPTLSFGGASKFPQAFTT